MRTGRAAEGETLARKVLAQVDDPRSRLSSGTVANVRGILAQARHDLGLPAQAEAATEADVDDLRVKMPRSGALASRLVQLAEMRAARGRVDEAAALLREGETLWLRYAGSPVPAGVTHTIALAKARLALAQGEPRAALDHLAVIPSQQAPNRTLERLAVLADVERADAARRAGRPDEALHAAERALARLRAVSEHRLPLVEGRALVALGRAQAALGRRADAALTLGAALQLQEAQLPPSSLWLADARLALGELLPRSDPARSRQLLAAARAARAALASKAPGRP
jgi:tetratricopeptide (TPR) repeat protein